MDRVRHHSGKARTGERARGVRGGNGRTRADLPEQQLWGTVLSCAIASRSARVLKELEPEA
ncbi:hypothetical protein AB0C60_03175, partial [Streptomyces sp. NPDC048845]